MAKIGLEIHGYINSDTKLFCSCKNIHGLKLTKPNTQICPICTGQPGAKPMSPKKNILDKAIQIGIVLECEINKKMSWQRKHYSWPDLPKGYQNTLSGPHAQPIGINGNFEGIKIRECHLEEDPASWNPETGKIDYNRSGAPLIEIVTEPDFKDSKEVEIWLRQLLKTLTYLKLIDKESGIKADVNISVVQSDYKRIEIKNVNSINNIKNVIDIEIKRQEKNPPKEQETRMYDPIKNETRKMRSKEDAQDYRFISDPDLNTILINQKRIDELKKKLPQTHSEIIKKITKKYNIQKKHAEILTKDMELSDLFEYLIERIKDKKLVIRWITEELMSLLNYNKISLENIDFNKEHFLELLELIEGGEISEQKAQEILRSWKEKSSSPKRELSSHKKITDKKELNKIVEEVLKENKKAMEDYKSGKSWALNFIMGKVMIKTNKRADLEMTKVILKEKLD